MSQRPAAETAWRVATTGVLLLAGGLSVANLLVAPGSGVAALLGPASRGFVFAAIPIGIRQFLFGWRGRAATQLSSGYVGTRASLWGIGLAAFVLVSSFLLVGSRIQFTGGLVSLVGAIIAFGVAAIFRRSVSGGSLWFIAAAVLAGILGGGLAVGTGREVTVVVALTAFTLGVLEGVQTGEIRITPSFPPPRVDV